MPISDPSYPNVTDAEFLEGMRRVKELGGLVLVHAESDSLLQDGIARMAAAGRRDPLAHHEARPPFVEEEAVHRALYLAAHAGVRIQIVHVSSPVSADLVRREKADGRPATMEICPHHLLLDLDDLARLGPYGVLCAGAARPGARGAAVGLRARRDRRLPRLRPLGLHARREGARLGRTSSTPFWAARSSRRPCRSCSTRPTTGAACRSTRSSRFSSTNAARIAGLYPRKGSLLPGADADLALYDLEGEWVVDAKSQQFSKNPWSPFDGRRVRARVVRTVVRGETVYADGEIVAEPGFGRVPVVPRRLLPAARTSSRR